MSTDIEKRIRQNIYKDDQSDCWIWTGQVSNAGYGKLRIKNSNNQLITESAQQISYNAFIRPTEPGEIAVNDCQNRLCVNPAHLKLISRS